MKNIPRSNSTYYYIAADYTIKAAKNQFTDQDIERIQTGNYFVTPEEANRVTKALYKACQLPEKEDKQEAYLFMKPLTQKPELKLPLELPPEESEWPILFEQVSKLSMWEHTERVRMYMVILRIQDENDYLNNQLKEAYLEKGRITEENSYLKTENEILRDLIKEIRNKI